jgi:hypothetical protein
MDSVDDVYDRFVYTDFVTYIYDHIVCPNSVTWSLWPHMCILTFWHKDYDHIV